MNMNHDEIIEINNDEYYFNNLSSGAFFAVEHYEIICEIKDSNNNYIQTPSALFIDYNEAFKIFNDWTIEYEYDRIKLEFVKKDGKRVYVETYNN